MKSLLLTSFLALAHPTFADSIQPINDFLLTAGLELNTSFKRGDTEEITSLTSWVDNAQIRVNTTASENLTFKNNAQSYELRVKPKAWGQRDLENDILKLRLAQRNNNFHSTLNAALQNRYLKLLDYLNRKNTTRYLLKSSKLLTQEIELLQSQLLSDNFKAENLLDTENMLQQSKSMAVLNLERLNAFQTQLRLPLNNADDLLNSSNGWHLSVADIANTISTINNAHQSSPEIVDSQLQLEMTRAENQKIKTEQQLGINFVKFAYNDRNNDGIEFQVGINIPLGNQFDSVESHHQQFAAQSDLNNNVNNMKQTLAAIQNKIRWLVQEQGIVHSQMKRVQNHLQKDYTKSNPSLTLSLRKELLSHNKKESDIHQKALSYYISFLALSGQLAQQPLRNWIQQGTPELIPNRSH